jgi:hypothetical protein
MWPIEEWKLTRVRKGHSWRKPVWWIQSIPDNGVTGAGSTPELALRDWRKHTRRRG